MKIIKPVFILFIIILFTISCIKKNVKSKSDVELKNEISILQKYLKESNEKYLYKLNKLELAVKYSYEDIAFLMNNIDSASLPDIDPFIEAIKNKIKKDINIKINNNLYKPFYITFCFNKPVNYNVNYLYADDTIHITEFPEVYDYSPIKINNDSKISLKTNGDFILYDDFNIGNPGKMHSDGYDSIRRLKNINDFKLPDNYDFYKDAEYILFTFVKHKDFDFYVKVVWVFKSV